MVHAQFSTPALRPTIYDENEVLMSSFLVKRPTQSTSSLDEQQDISSVLHHNMPWKSNHRYWCVLRRGQFSYYKDQTERKAERVVLVADLLYCRIYDENMLDLYTREKTFRFKADDYALAQKWEQAFKQVMQGRGESTVAEPATEEPCLASELPAEIVRPREEAGPTRHEDDEEEEDDGFDVVCETDFEAAPHRVGQLSAAEQRSAATSDVASVNNGGVPEEDKAFYEAYNPHGNERLIQSGLLYGQVRNSIRRKKWKPFKGELTNHYLKLVSVATSQVFATIDLAEVVDCVELDKNDPCFALIVTTQRFKFKAKNDEELVDWIINIKSSVIVRERLPQAPQ
ncbi:AaceriAER261Cp [[Ashbya] aceris (nom. inval.)]|nr:AaceriAER261Cp [[Ashbya] aceris (nom. inval.)]